MGIVSARFVMGGGGFEEVIDAYLAGYGWLWETDPEGGGAGWRGDEDACSCVGEVGCVDRREEGGGWEEYT